MSSDNFFARPSTGAANFLSLSLRVHWHGVASVVFLPSFPSPLCPRATTRQTFDLGNGFPCRHNRMRPPWRSLLVTELKSDQDIDVNGRRNFDSGPKFVVVCTKVRAEGQVVCRLLRTDEPGAGGISHAQLPNRAKVKARARVLKTKLLSHICWFPCSFILA